MNFLVRFLLCFYLLIVVGQTQLEAQHPQYDITRISTRTFEDSPRTDHCRIKQVVISTSPSREDKNHDEIEIPSNENREEDENEEDEDERASSKKNNYFSSFFYSQTPEYFSGFNKQYFSFCRNEFLRDSSKCILYQVFRI